MSKCSELCNQIKDKIDSVSGLDDDYTYEWLLSLLSATNYTVNNIINYVNKDNLNETCFKECEPDVGKLDKLLIKYHIIPGYLGYDYIKTILELDILNTGYRMQDIYKLLSEKYNVTVSSVERAIRHLLSISDIHKPNKQALYLLNLEYKGV